VALSGLVQSKGREKGRKTSVKYSLKYQVVWEGEKVPSTKRKKGVTSSQDMSRKSKSSSGLRKKKKSVQKER